MTRGEAKRQLKKELKRDEEMTSEERLNQIEEGDADIGDRESGAWIDALKLAIKGPALK